MENINYAVTILYSFDTTRTTYLFENFDDAWSFLTETMKEELRIDKEENGWDVEYEESKENGTVILTDHFHDHDDITTGYVSDVDNGD